MPKKTLLYLASFFILLVAIIFIIREPDVSLATLKAQYATGESKFVEINGMPVHYRDEGVGAVIVLLHGTAASLHTWDDWTEQLKEHYRVIRMDLPAFGLTGPHPERDYSVNAYATFLKTFLEELEVERFHLAGNSLGGYIAWYYASQYPEKVDHLVLLDPSGWPADDKSPWIFRLARTPVLNFLVKSITPKSIIRKNLEQVYYEDSKVSESLIERYHQMALRKGNRQAFIDRSKTKTENHKDKLLEIEAPTLLLWGAEDAWISPALGPQFAATIPNATLKIMEQVGHVPMEEAPEESLKLVLDFLQH